MPTLSSIPVAIPPFSQVLAGGGCGVCVCVCVSMCFSGQGRGGDGERPAETVSRKIRA